MTVYVVSNDLNAVAVFSTFEAASRYAEPRGLQITIFEVDEK